MGGMKPLSNRFAQTCCSRWPNISWKRSPLKPWRLLECGPRFDLFRHLQKLSQLKLARALCCVLAARAISQTSFAAEVDLSHWQPSDFAEMSLEELMNIEVTSVSKKTEKLSEAAAAIHVITNDDIR